METPEPARSVRAVPASHSLARGADVYARPLWLHAAIRGEGEGGWAVNALDTFALRLMHQKLGEWLNVNVEALAAGGSKVQGDLNATGMLYSEACGFIRALNEVRDKLCKEVEDELRANQ